MIRCCLLVVGVALYLTVAASVSAQTQAPGATATALPDKPRYPHPKNREEKLANLLDYLEKDYIKKTAAPFWVPRAMGVISLARSPRPTVLPRLLELCERDKNAVVRLLAWQALLARAEELDESAHKRWIGVTLTLAEIDAFHGALRVHLLDVLATSVPTVRHRKIWMKIFDETNAWEPRDIPTLDALGRSLATWKSAFLAQGIIKKLTDVDSGVRAEYVLKAAGSPIQSAKERLGPAIFDPQSKDRAHPSSESLFRTIQTETNAWLSKAKWREVTALPDAPWKRLQPAFVPAPAPLESIDPDDVSWLADLELGRVDLNDFEAVFVVDATGSMGDVLAWLRGDVATVMAALGALCKEAPRLGVVFYRDAGQGDAFVTKVVPMTYKIQDLQPALAAMTAEGGGDVPEAIEEALKAAIEKTRWSVSKRTGKLVILIGDAPPKPGTEEACKTLAMKAKEMGLKFYAVKVTNAMAKNDLSVYDGIAAAAGGSTIEATFPALSNNRFVDDNNQNIPVQMLPRPETQLIIAPASAGAPAGEKILTQVLTEAIHPQYADRVEPLARTLLAHVQPKSEPEKRLPYPADTPSLLEGSLKPQGK